MEHSTDEVSEVCKSERIQKMHRRICQIKASEKTEVKYMQSWEERIMIKQEGIAEGRIEGEKALLKSLIEKKMAKKLLVGDVRFAIMFMREVSCRKIMPVRYAVMEQMILNQYMKANCCAQRSLFHHCVSTG